MWRGLILFNVFVDEGCVVFSRFVDGVATYFYFGGVLVSVFVGIGGVFYMKNVIGVLFMEKEFYEYGYVWFIVFNCMYLYGEY